MQSRNIIGNFLSVHERKNSTYTKSKVCGENGTKEEWKQKWKKAKNMTLINVITDLEIFVYIKYRTYIYQISYKLFYAIFAFEFFLFFPSF